MREKHEPLADLRASLGKYLSDEDVRALLPVVERYPFALPDHWAKLITAKDDPLWKQCVPDARELAAPLPQESADPLEELKFSPLPGLIHRYTDRALILLTSRCAGYCRFCTRKHRAGAFPQDGRQAAVQEAVIPWLRAHPAVRDVLLSGGDPFTLDTSELTHWLRELRGLPQLALIRIGTRLPSFAPARIDERFCAALAPFAPLYINTHFNHPREITPDTRAACERMRAAGMILSNQTVLLRDVNDDAAILRALGYGLLSMGVRPYYLHVPDQVAGTGHFRVPLARAAALWEELCSTTSGMAVPRLMIDLAGGGGKIQYMRARLLRTEAVSGAEDTIQYVFRNTENGESVYRE